MHVNQEGRMAANLNLKQRVKSGLLTVALAKQLLLHHAGTDADKTSTWRWLCRLESAQLLRGLVGVVSVIVLAGCITPYQEPSGKFIKVAATEERSSFGTNFIFGRLQRCDGPEKKVLWYAHSDFTNCVMLTKAEQDEWEHGYSRGAGPEIVGAAIVGGSVGAGAALGGGANAVAGASASATNIAVQTVGKGKR